MQAQPGAGRHAEQGGQRQAAEHDGNRRGLALGRDQAGGDDGAHAKEGAVRQRGDHARRHQAAVVRRQRAGQVAQREDGHQRQQHGFARQLARGQRQHRRAHRHAQRVAGNQQPGRSDGDAQVGGDLHQQAHDDELGRAYAEGADGEGQQAQGE
jgi:hypothetical protein